MGIDRSALGPRRGACIAAVLIATAVACFAGAGETRAAIDPAQGYLVAAADATYLLPEGQEVQRVFAAGDVNADGRDDLVVFTTHDRDGHGGQSLWLLPGRATSGIFAFSEGGAVRLLGGESGRYLDPASARALGDVNGDGSDDISVDHYRVDDPHAETLILWGGPAIAPLDTSAAEPEGFARVQTRARWNVLPLGDIDGDGSADLVLSGSIGAGDSYESRLQVVRGGARFGSYDPVRPDARNSLTIIGDDSAAAGPPTGVGDLDGDGAKELFGFVERSEETGQGELRQTYHLRSIAATETGTLAASSLTTIPSRPAWWGANGIDSLEGVGTTLTIRDENATLSFYPPRTPFLSARRPMGALTGARSASAAVNLTASDGGDFDGDGKVDLLVTDAHENCKRDEAALVTAVSITPDDPATPLRERRALLTPGPAQGMGTYGANHAVVAADLNGDGRSDLVAAGSPQTRAGHACTQANREIRITFGSRLPVCAGPYTPQGQRAWDFAPGASLRRTRQSNYGLNVDSLRTNQRIAASAIRRLNAVRDWLNAGIEGRDICGDVFDERHLVAGTQTTNGPLAARAPADPRPLEISGRINDPDAIRVTRRQLLVNQRIYQAAILRANALAERLTHLTGGDVRDGSLDERVVRGDVVLGAGPDRELPRASAPPRERTRDNAARIKLSRQQVGVNRRIAWEVYMRARNLQGRVESGLVGENFAPGSLSVGDFAG